MRRLLYCLAATAGLALSAPAAEPVAGNWKVTTSTSPTADHVDCIVKLDKSGDRWTAGVVSSGEIPHLQIDSLKVTGDQFRLVMRRGTAASTFEGKLGDAKTIVGSMCDERRCSPAKLIWTEEATVNRSNAEIKKDVPEPLKQYRKLQEESGLQMAKWRQEKDAEQKKKIMTDMQAAQRSMAADGPKLFKQVLAEHRDHPSALDAAMFLIQGAGRGNGTEAEVRGWCEIVLEKAGNYGPRYRTDTLIRLAETLGRTKNLSNVGIEFAKQAEKQLGPDAPANSLYRVIKVLEVAPDVTEASKKEYAMRLAKLDARLDADYLAKMEGYHVKPYAGRKTGGSKTVLMELFTGAQCPPCVGADIAFDKLGEAYKSTDVILLQYHLHIPGPDPLNNHDTEVRQKYYKVNSTPTTFFNGKKDGGSGGFEIHGPVKFEAYVNVINPILDEAGLGNLTLKAKRTGDAISFDAAVADLAQPGDNMKLRIALVEENVHYTGGNGLRYHHHVVRALPGGPEGIPLAGKNETKQARINLTELRGNLTKYLDEYAATPRGKFSKPDRPMELKNLKAVAWVQDDKTQAVLMAVEVDVAERTGG